MSDLDRTPATHDVGGAPRFLCLAVAADDAAPPDGFGKRVDALRQVLAAKGLMTVDELRRGIEQQPADEYERASYYERWFTSIATLMLEKGVVTEAELEA